jgi:hypothetical protein
MGSETWRRSSICHSCSKASSPGRQTGKPSPCSSRWAWAVRHCCRPPGAVQVRATLAEPAAEAGA